MVLNMYVYIYPGTHTQRVLIHKLLDECFPCNLTVSPLGFAFKLKFRPLESSGKKPGSYDLAKLTQHIITRR